MGLDMGSGAATLALVQYELLLFAGVFFLVGALDEFAMDVAWVWLRLTGRTQTYIVPHDEMRGPALTGRAAVIIPTWHEAQVIGDTIAHALAAWPQVELRLYIGCYGNDPATVAAAMHGARNDPRLRIVVHDNMGPTTKADCLNRCYRALIDDEARSGIRYRMVLLHDAEDMVDPAALGLLDRSIDSADFVQLPVLPVPQRESRWVGSHYCEEFAEAHGRTMVVRDALGASLPAAGVGCVFSRDILEQIAKDKAAAGATPAPFSVDSLTEDYELGFRVREAGGRSRFLRVRDEHGRLVATRAYFPGSLEASVRQKGRWIHGIALQGWDRLGWGGGLGETWMRLRDRRGLISALVLLAGYTLLILIGVSAVMALFGQPFPTGGDRLAITLLAANLAALIWRSAVRFIITSREYGGREGARAILRIPVANIIAIMAARRALFAYVGTLRGSPVTWDKTEHDAHPTRGEDALPALGVAA